MDLVVDPGQIAVPGRVRQRVRGLLLVRLEVVGVAQVRVTRDPERDRAVREEAGQQVALGRGELYLRDLWSGQAGGA